MLAFELYVNGQKQYVAGLDDPGRLVGMAHSVNINSPPTENLETYVCGGVLEPEPKKLKWSQIPLGLGDEVTIKIVRRDDCDAPQDPDQLPKSAQENINEFYQSKYEKGRPDEGDD